MANQTVITVNGQQHVVTADPATPLLYILRNELGLRAAKFGCGVAQCGVCSVLLDGHEIRSCVTPVQAVAGRRVTTLEGLGDMWQQRHTATSSAPAAASALSSTPAATSSATRASTTASTTASTSPTVSISAPAPNLHPVQVAWIKLQVPQCGYCQSGMMIQAVSLLSAKPQPTKTEIRTALEGHICRCGTHLRILAAIEQAAQQMAGEA
jgi:isoquinoline 1-oxidoreductase alpha subunit